MFYLFIYFCYYNFVLFYTQHSFKQLALKLEANEFMQDYHFNDCFLFNDVATRVILNHEAYHNKLFALQDKVVIFYIFDIF